MASIDAEASENASKSPEQRIAEGTDLRVQADLDAGLNLVFCFDEQIKQFVRVDDRLAIVRHESNDRLEERNSLARPGEIANAETDRVPLVDDLYGQQDCQRLDNQHKRRRDQADL